MKSSSLMLAVIAALLGGIVGAFVFSVVAPPTAAPRQDTASVDAKSAEPYDDGDLRAAVKRSEDELATLRLEIGALTTELNAARRERAGLAGSNKVVTEEPEEGEVSPAARAGTPESSDSELKAEVDQAVKDALARAQKEEREKAIAAKRGQTQKWIDDGRERVLKKLDAELSLTTIQRENISKVFDSMNARMADLYEEAETAKENGEAFDWNAEWGALIEDTDAAIRAEIGTAQLPAYDELAGEHGFIGIAWPGK
ncbi:MAG: hypothetical protein R3E76_01040 [Planctomycetota bacterium]